MLSAPILLLLALLASFSPLLTLAALWQLKEWRWDRLSEHLSREGWFPALAGGRLRLGSLVPIVIALFFLPWRQVLELSLGILSLLTLLQTLARHQKSPVWTLKARVLVAAALLLNAVLAAPFSWFPTPASLALLLLPLLQAPLLAAAWYAFRPTDRALKRRIFERARLLREAHPEIIVIGITGSVGKTTTKELLAHILSTDRHTDSSERNPLATPAHVNTEMGVAQWLIASLKNRGSFTPGTPLIVEMGAYHAGEIATLCSIVRPSIGIVTFIGNQHLALFGSQEALVSAKGELLRSLPPTGHAFLNGDCERCRDMRSLASCPVTVVGTGGYADLEAFEIEETPTGIRFVADDVRFSVPLHGTHNAANVLLAIAVARKLGMDTRAIAERIRVFSPPHHSFDVRVERGVTILDATHNASAASFKAAIAWAGTQPFNRKVLLTSGLIELGSEHERTHRELGALAADVFDDVIFLDDKAARIFAEGFGSGIRRFSRSTPPVPADSLLVCVGRMPQMTIRRLLPPSP